MTRAHFVVFFMVSALALAEAFLIPWLLRCMSDMAGHIKEAEGRADHYRAQWYQAMAETDEWRRVACRTSSRSALFSPPSIHWSNAEQSVYEELIDAGRRALARTHHPDAGGNGERMTLINAVADKAKRAGRAA